MTEMENWNRQVIEEFRANGGKINGPLAGFPLLLLTTTGARSGQRRVSPLAYRAEGDRLFVFASKGGAPTSPDWYHNLVAHPEVTVEVGAETFEATAIVIEGEERDQIYTRQGEQYPNFAEYQTKTTRKIPVVELKRH